MGEIRKIALLGQPNSGKSTVFNALTGMHQHVGNWPGKTVEKKEGTFTYNDIEYQVADLPGSYSLSANSDEEIVTRDYIASGEADLVCILADASQLERSLFMLADYAGIQTPVMLLLTMIDVAAQQGKLINSAKLSQLLQIPVVGIVAPDRKNYGDFYQALENHFKAPKSLDASAMFELYQQGEKRTLFEEAKQIVPAAGIEQYSGEWLASKLIEGDQVVAEKISAQTDKNIVDAFLKRTEEGSIYTSDCKFQWIERLIRETVSRTKKPSDVLTKFDKAAISKRWGKWIAIGIIVLGLVGSMMIAMPIMGLGSVIPTILRPAVEGLVGVGVPGWLVDFINGTVVTALGWTLAMLGFVFGINLVFGLIEEVGYMARVSYAFDNTMSKLGLQGKAIMPLLIGFGCTIGGAAGTRVIDSWGQRILTIALVWAVPCGATFAVIPTLAGTFFGWGGTLVMVLLFVIMFLHIMITAKIFGRKLSPIAERTGMIMELPPYHKPRWGALIRQTLNRVWGVFKKAFIVVVAIAAIFWILSYSSSGVASDSILYKIGVTIEPITKIFGMRWQMFMAFVASMVSKEAVLGVMSVLLTGNGTIFGSTVGTVAADANITTMLSTAISKPEALAFIVAVTFNVPCIMAVASTYQESHSLKWTLKIAGYYILTALILSCITYHIAELFC